MSTTVYIFNQLINFNIKSFQFFQAIEFFLLYMEKVTTFKYPSSFLAMSLKLILQERGGAMTLLEFCKVRKRREKHNLKTACGWLAGFIASSFKISHLEVL